jgi:hypothetical protein
LTLPSSSFLTASALTIAIAPIVTVRFHSILADYLPIDSPVLSIKRLFCMGFNNFRRSL